MQETRVSFLSGEDPLEKEMATSILAWKGPWTEEPGSLQSIGLQRVGHYGATERTRAHTHTRTICPWLREKACHPAHDRTEETACARIKEGNHNSSTSSTRNFSVNLGNSSLVLWFPHLKFIFT